MPSEKNPFEILGLNPQIIKGLSDSEIRMLVKSQYRTLQKIYHPDKNTGNDAKSRELNVAYDLLDPQKNPLEFNHYKGRFLKPTPIKRRLLELEEELSSVVEMRTAEEVRHYEQLLAYFMGFSDIESGQTVFNLYSSKIRLLDEGLRFNLQKK